MVIGKHSNPCSYDIRTDSYWWYFEKEQVLVEKDL